MVREAGQGGKGAKDPRLKLQNVYVVTNFQNASIVDRFVAFAAGSSLRWVASKLEGCLEQQCKT